MRTLILTCTPDRFDVASYFNGNDVITWRQTKSCQPGDQAYVYVGRPLSCIKYLCEVIETDIAAESVDSDYYRSQTATKRSKNKPYMKLKLLCELSGRGLSLSELLEHGLKTVQCTTEASDELKIYLASAIRRNGNGDTNKR